MDETKSETRSRVDDEGWVYTADRKQRRKKTGGSWEWVPAGFEGSHAAGGTEEERAKKREEARKVLKPKSENIPAAPSGGSLAGLAAKTKKAREEESGQKRAVKKKAKGN